MIVNEFGVIRALVAQSDAIGFVPGEAVRGEIERGEFKEIRLAPNQRELQMVPMLIATLKDCALPPAAHDGPFACLPIHINFARHIFNPNPGGDGFCVVLVELGQHGMYRYTRGAYPHQAVDPNSF